jgi:hypothetical protein
MKMRLFTSKEPEKVNQDEEKKFESTKDDNADPEAIHTEQIDPVIEKRVRRKLDTHIVPLLSALYLLAFLDRSNIGYARTPVHRRACLT